MKGLENLKDGQGALQVEGSTAAYFYVVDKDGKPAGSQALNKILTLDPGTYTVRVNNSSHIIEIRADELAKCSTGTLIISGNTFEKYQVMDSTGMRLAYETLGKSMSLFPGIFKIQVNDTEITAQVKLKEITEIRTGTILVRGTTGEYYYVLDNENKQLNYSTMEKPLAFFPGVYVVKVNNTSREAEVFPGNVAELATGNILVKGLTEEYYYVTDSVGNALNYQTLNKSLAFFPGDYHIKVNNTPVLGKVSAGQTAEFMTGSLMLTGGGSEYYYVLDETGNQLNYNSLNKSLSFFPSDYTVRLGSSTLKATVIGGELTSINAFN
ncbi:MAG TPA: hypothetical protein VIQ51_13125 [Chryseosolibacter sp.]